MITRYSELLNKNEHEFNDIRKNIKINYDHIDDIVGEFTCLICTSRDNIIKQCF